MLRMGNDRDLRRSMLWLAVLIIVVGIWTQSWKKMVVTYFVGMGGIAGILLPDWDFFDRDVSQWTQPVTVDQIQPHHVLRHGSTRFRFYPVRTVIYAVVYAFGLYKWWKYITR